MLTEGAATPEEIASYITPENHQPTRRLDSKGRPCHWISEVWAEHKANGYGGSPNSFWIAERDATTLPRVKKRLGEPVMTPSRRSLMIA